MTEQPVRSRREIWDERHADRDPIESHEPDPILVEVTAGLRPGRALDLATGDGRNAVWLARQGWSVTAVDFSQVALDRARRSGVAAGLDPDWVLADLLDWRPPRRTYDLVAVVFLHLPAAERRSVYAGAAEAVAPGGHLVIIGHDRSNLTEGSGGPQDPAVLFTADEIAAEIDGLRIERAERVAHEPAGGSRTLDAVVVAVRPGD
jgi:SAM-dependent methyltransferase